jgi:hypothetical protein
MLDIPMFGRMAELIWTNAWLPGCQTLSVTNLRTLFRVDHSEYLSADNEPTAVST